MEHTPLILFEHSAAALKSPVSSKKAGISQRTYRLFGFYAVCPEIRDSALFFDLWKTQTFSGGRYRVELFLRMRSSPSCSTIFQAQSQAFCACASV